MATCCDFGRKSFWQNKNKESSQSWATTEITWNMYWNRFLWNGMQHFFVFYTFWYIHDEKFSPSHNFDIKNNFLLFLRSSSALLFCNRSNYFSSISRAIGRGKLWCKYRHRHHSLLLCNFRWAASFRRWFRVFFFRYLRFCGVFEYSRFFFVFPTNRRDFRETLNYLLLQKWLFIYFLVMKWDVYFYILLF